MTDEKPKASGSLTAGRRLDRIEGKLDKLLTDVAALKVKAGLWGALGALAVTMGLRLQGCA